MSDVLFELGDDHVGVITLNRPDARNALTHGMYAELERLVREALEWATTRGARSGRVAWQFTQDLAGRLGPGLGERPEPTG